MNEILISKLLNPSIYFVVPEWVLDIPFAFPEWEKTDENGNGTGEYYSPRELDRVAGPLLNIVYRLDGYGQQFDENGNEISPATRWGVFRYGLDIDTIASVEQMFDSNGLVNVRKQSDGSYLIPAALNYDKFTGNEYMILPPHLATQLPHSKPQEALDDQL